MEVAGKRELETGSRKRVAVSVCVGQPGKQEGSRGKERPGKPSREQRAVWGMRKCEREHERACCQQGS